MLTFVARLPLYPTHRSQPHSFRRQKEKNQLSEAQKAALRTNFGEIEEDEFQDEAPRAKVGVVSGRARAYEANQKVGAVSKRMQKRLQQQAKVSGGMSTIRGSNTSGTASVSFTPLQVRSEQKETRGVGREWESGQDEEAAAGFNRNAPSSSPPHRGLRL